MQVGRHHADHQMRFAIDLNPRAHHRGVPMEARVPQSVAQDYLVEIRSFLFGQEVAAHCRPHPQRAKEVVRHLQGRKLDRLAGAHQRQVGALN